jgi:hypothetical protein
MRRIKSLVLLAALLGVAILLTGCPGGTSQTTTDLVPTSQTTTELIPTRKPAIYLYPATTLDIRVQLTYGGRLTCSYPAYNDGWLVTAQPDGTLINKADGREYAYLFWEGLANEAYDFSRGFVVRGEDTADFLEQKLDWLGLSPREMNDFIVYWLPQMQENPYNLITFQDEAYTRLALLDIQPCPDSLLRVFMAYKPLQEPIAIEEQVLRQGIRRGFTVVEWGGSCVG